MDNIVAPHFEERFINTFYEVFISPITIKRCRNKWREISIQKDLVNNEIVKRLFEKQNKSVVWNDLLFSPAWQQLKESFPSLLNYLYSRGIRVRLTNRLLTPCVRACWWCFLPRLTVTGSVCWESLNTPSSQPPATGQWNCGTEKPRNRCDTIHWHFSALVAKLTVLSEPRPTVSFILIII